MYSVPEPFGDKYLMPKKNDKDLANFLSKPKSMVYAKRPTRTRIVRRIRKPAYAKRNPASITKIVKRTIRGMAEHKYAQTTVTSSTFGANSGYVNALTNVAQGSGAQDRIGNKIALCSYQISGRLKTQASGNSRRRVMFYLVSYNLTPNSPAIGDFLDTDGAGNYSSMSFRNPDKFKHFKVITKRTIIIPQETVSGQEADMEFLYYGKLKLTQNYSAGNASDIKTSQLYVIMVCDDGTTAGSSGISIEQYKARINYTDL